MAKNEQFLVDVFKMAPTILPLQNLGEVAFILQQPKQAFVLLDMCLKLYKHLDFENMSKFKTLSLLGALME